MSEDQIKQLVNSYIATDDESQEQEIIQSLNKACVPANVLLLVKSLGSFLTLENELVRAKATKCLADYIMDTSNLRLDQVKFLVEFFSSKLEERGSYSSVLKALTRLSSQYELFADLKSLVLKRIRDSSDYAIDKTDRSQVLAILDIYKQSQSPEFVDTFVQAITGEKNPDNLVKALQLESYLLGNYEVTKQQKDDLFDCVFCYFPVTFSAQTTSKTDQRVVLREMLEVLLIRPEFVELTVPGILKKLNALSLATKSESLGLLLHLLRSNKISNELVLKIYDSILKLVLEGPRDEELQTQLLTTVVELVKAHNAILDTAQEAFKAGISAPSTDSIHYSKIFAQIDLELGLGACERALQEYLSAVDNSTTSLNNNYAEVLHNLLQSNFQSVDSLILENYLQKLESTQGIAVPLITALWTDLALAYESKLDVCVEKLLQLENGDITKCLQRLVEKYTGAWPTILNALRRTATLKSGPEQYHMIQSVLAKIPSSIEQQQAVLKFCTELFDDKTSLCAFLDHFEKHQKPDPITRNLEFELAAQILGSSELDPEVLERFARVLDLHYDESAESTEPYEIVKSFLPHLLATPSRKLGICLSALSASDLGQIDLDNLKMLAQADDFYTRLQYLRLAALVANVCPAKISTEQVQAQLQANDEFGAWITKGLLMSGNEVGFRCLENTIANFKSSLGCRRKLNILESKDQVIHNCKAAVVRRLASQRLVVCSTSSILKLFKQGNTAEFCAAAGIAVNCWTDDQLNTVSSQFAPYLPLLFDHIVAGPETGGICRLTSRCFNSKTGLDLVDGFKLFSSIMASCTNQSSSAVTVQMISLLEQLYLHFKDSEPFSDAQFRKRQVYALQSLLESPVRDIRKRTADFVQKLYV